MTRRRIVKLPRVTVDVDGIFEQLSSYLKYEEGRPYVPWELVPNAVRRHTDYNPVKAGERLPHPKLKWAKFMEDVKELSGLECTEAEMDEAKRGHWVGGFPVAIADALNLKNGDPLRDLLLTTSPEARRSMKPTYSKPGSQRHSLDDMIAERDKTRSTQSHLANARKTGIIGAHEAQEAPKPSADWIGKAAPKGGTLGDASPKGKGGHGGKG